MIKICVHCGKPFEVDENDRNDKRRRYCGFDCIDSAKYAREREWKLHGKKPQQKIICEVCGKEFYTNYSQKITCSPECQRERHKKMVNENNRARREAIQSGALPRQQKKGQKKVETLAEFNRKAREMNMSYGEYDKYLRIQAMQKERAQSGRT